MHLVPENLRRAHEDGEVLFFCGAGVSVPAGLKSFRDLVGAVLKDLLPPRETCERGTLEKLAWKAFDEDKYDDALDILENRREGGFEPRNVRERVRYHLTRPKTKTLENHFILAQLADLDSDQGRLVTTNFDPLFERAQSKLRKLTGSKHKLEVHVAPVLPPAKPETSSGLTHLHGKLGCSSDDRGLVLTTADFGTAYLLEGWARRFAVELFRHYRIVFVGYRVEDPTMRYLVSALAAAREENEQFKEAYAFAPYAEGDDTLHLKEEAEQEWKLKGLTPLAYCSADNHLQLWQELGNWADDHRQGIMGRRQSVARLGKFPPADEDDPATPEMEWALQDGLVAKHFADLTGNDRPDPAWIAPFQKAGLLSQPIGQTKLDKPIFAPLVSVVLPDHLELNEATFHLGRWIASCIDTGAALDWALREGGILHQQFRLQIQRALNESGGSNIPGGLRKVWRVLAEDDYAHALSERRTSPSRYHSRLERENIFAIRTFLTRLRPIPVFKVKRSFFDEGRDADPERARDWCEIGVELVGIEGDYDVERFRKRAVDWDGALAVMADDITTRLKEAMDWFKEFDLASRDDDLTLYRYPSISPHEQNRYTDTWTELIALARDAYDALVNSGDDAAAARLARRWQSLPFPIFQRLALYAATGEPDA